jgi:ABC-2 type transport system permease protein
MIGTGEHLERPNALVEEVRKLPAFFRRDFLVVLSYPFSFVFSWFTLLVTVIVFNLLGQIVDVGTLPTYKGVRPTYLEFVAIGMGLAMIMQVGLTKVMTAIRGEQLIGTLESLLITPTAPATLQVGSAIYDALYIPLRTVVFFFLVSAFFDVSFAWSGLGPGIAVILAFLPFVWGLGVAAAAAVLTFRQGSSAIGLGLTALVVASGTYFPIDVLPGPFSTIARYNPVAIAIEGMRDALLGRAGWADVLPGVLELAPISIVALILGMVSFRLALKRERRRGTIGLY